MQSELVYWGWRIAAVLGPQERWAFAETAALEGLVSLVAGVISGGVGRSGTPVRSMGLDRGMVGFPFPEPPNPSSSFFFFKKPLSLLSLFCRSITISLRASLSSSKLQRQLMIAKPKPVEKIDHRTFSFPPSFGGARLLGL
ncbi:hypothetical protein L484_012419 [Morus notabilis]|uniref:Uncharacterized protein n=1 Tax=Morus notabilis TaxID=981085 RepID=W9RQI5_9ROSA|nr:hypothetical protein L484_012419 [Morus notabilis]